MDYIDLGISEYKESYRIQRETAEKVAAGMRGNTLIITEHKKVITIGRTGSDSNVFKSEGMDVLKIDRGGDVTYHGPGQLVAYPIFKFEKEARDIHNFFGYMEDVGINFLNKYGVSAEAKPGLRGVWTGDGKIGSIGIGIKKWVTYHGMAININTDMTPFSFINPCGVAGIRMTSLEILLGKKIDIGDAKFRLRDSFEEVSLLAEARHKG